MAEATTKGGSAEDCVRLPVRHEMCDFALTAATGWHVVNARLVKRRSE